MKGGGIGYVFKARSVVDKVRSKLERLAWQGSVVKTPDTIRQGTYFEFESDDVDVCIFIGDSSHGVPQFQVSQGRAAANDEDVDIVEVAEKIDLWLETVLDQSKSSTTAKEKQAESLLSQPGKGLASLGTGSSFLAAANPDSMVIPACDIQVGENFFNLRARGEKGDVSVSVSEDADIAMAYLYALRNSSSWILGERNHCRFELEGLVVVDFSFEQADSGETLLLRGQSRADLEKVRDHILARARQLAEGEIKGALDDAFHRELRNLKV